MKLQTIIAHIVVEVYGFKSFAKLLRLGYAFFKTESFESFKKRSWTRNFDHCRPRLDFFSCEVFEVQRKPLFSSHLSIVTCCAYTKRRRSHKPLKQVNHLTVKLKTLIWVFERIKALDGAMRMYSNYKVTDRASGRSFDYDPPCR